MLLFPLEFRIKESDDLRTLDCYSRCIAVQIAFDVTGLDVIIKGRSPYAQYLRHFNFLIVPILADGRKN